MAIAFSSSTSSHQVLKLKISADLKFGFAFKLRRKGSFVSRFAEDTLPTFKGSQIFICPFVLGEVPSKGFFPFAGGVIN